MKNGKVIADAITSFLQENFGGHPVFDAAEEAINSCSREQTPEDRCEAAARFLGCIRTALRDANIDIL